jgi:agmatine/peptidylarginine deiminase
MNRKLKLDFERTSSLFLAYPEGVVDCGVDYSPATEVYNDLIKALPWRTNLILFVKSAEILKKVSKLHKRSTILVNSELSSIWIRDSAGFNMGTHIVKPIFKPKYYRKYFEEAALIDQNMKIIHSLLGVDMVKLPLIWDCGNLVTNGEVGFITDQILSDNKKTYNESQVKELIRAYLNIEPIIIPIHPDDAFGHSDAYMTFLNNATLAISKYPETANKKDLKYLDEIRAIAEKHVSTIVEIKENPTYEVKDEIESARGLYVNLLSLGDQIFIPSYDNSTEENHNYELLCRYGKVHKIKADRLATFGGLLHCISFTN